MTERGGSIYGSAGWTLLGFSIAHRPPLAVFPMCLPKSLSSEQIRRN